MTYLSVKQKTNGDFIVEHEIENCLITDVVKADKNPEWYAELVSYKTKNSKSVEEIQPTVKEVLDELEALDKSAIMAIVAILSEKFSKADTDKLTEIENKKAQLRLKLSEIRGE